MIPVAFISQRFILNAAQYRIQVCFFPLNSADTFVLPYIYMFIITLVIIIIIIIIIIIVFIVIIITVILLLGSKYDLLVLVFSIFVLLNF